LQGVPLPDRLGAAGAAGVIVTRSGVILGGGNDNALNAFDTNGRELWRYVLPRETSGTPVTYLDANGKQVVVIATGRGEDTALVAFRIQ
jgi:quinoprotein glucose dehydrogenase